MDLRVDVRGGGSGERAFAAMLEQWMHGGKARRGILEAVREEVEGPAPPLTEEQAAVALGPTAAILEHGMDGIPLTAGGSFQVDFVHELAAGYPEWAGGAEASQVRREADLPMLRNLRVALVDCSHLRCEKGVAFAYEDSAGLVKNEPIAFLLMLGCALVRDQGFFGDTAELCAALLLAGAPLDVDQLAERSMPALAEQWQAGGGPISLEAVRIAVSLWVDHASAVGCLPDLWAAELRAAGGDWPGPVGDVGRACQVALLRYRVVRLMDMRTAEMSVAA